MFLSQRALLEDFTPAAVPGRYLVDSLPILNYLPSFIATWKNTAQELFSRQEKLFVGHMMDVKRDVASGQDAHCFVKYMMDMQKESGLTDQEIAFLAGVMVSRAVLSSSESHILTSNLNILKSTAPDLTQHPMRSLLSS